MLANVLSLSASVCSHSRQYLIIYNYVATYIHIVTAAEIERQPPTIIANGDEDYGMIKNIIYGMRLDTGQGEITPPTCYSHFLISFYRA